MKYKGIELEEVTEPQIFDPPKKMVVWDSYLNMTELEVYAIVSHKDYPVICKNSTWLHCAEIPEVQESKPVTYRELARWLSKGNGEAVWANNVLSNWNYSTDEENKALDASLSVRKWDDIEWHKPTREYLGLDGKQMEREAENVENIRNLALCKEKLKVQTSIAEEIEKMAGTYHTSYAEAVKDLYEKNKAIRHQKYKRCLAMSEWCNAEIGIADTDGDYKAMQRYQKWYKRWLELAKNFNPDNSTAQYGK